MPWTSTSNVIHQPAMLQMSKVRQLESYRGSGTAQRTTVSFRAQRGIPTLTTCHSEPCDSVIPKRSEESLPNHVSFRSAARNPYRHAGHCEEATNPWILVKPTIAPET